MVLHPVSARTHPPISCWARRFFLTWLLLTTTSLFAGGYSQNFSGGTFGTQTIGDASTLASTAGILTTGVRYWSSGNKALQLMGTYGGNAASWKMPDLDPGKEIQSFDATFTVGTYRANPTAVPGAGWAFCFGALPGDHGGGETGFVMPGGLVIGWDLYNNGNADNPSIEVFCSGASVANYPSATLSDSPLPDSGNFVLSNPVTGGSTAPIPFNANGAAVQSAMRAVPGWEVVSVSGNAGGLWVVNHGVTGAYSDPVSDTSGLLPAGSSLSVKTTPGNATTNEQWQISERAYRGRIVSVHWDFNGLDLSVNGLPVFTDLATPGFSPVASNRFGFSARCEPSNTMDLFFDDVIIGTTQIQPTETGGPVITEFMADNSSNLEDEDTDSPDWIEIYNGQSTTVNLAGYRLTNVEQNNSLWTFPSVSLAPYSYRIVYASGKNRLIASGLLHTNFTLQRESGYLALIKPDGVSIASEFRYGTQFQDVSFGEKGPGRTLGYLQPATPGAKVLSGTLQAAGGPAEDVVWSRTGGLISGSTPITIAAPVAAGSVIRYTLDNSEPGPASSIYNPATPPAAFSVTSSTNLRARIYTPGLLPGPVTSRTYLLLDTSLTNYNGSGQVFSSHLPIIVIDSFGTNVDGDAAAGQPFRYTYAVVLDKDPISGRASLTQPAVDFQGRGGTHVRGSSSAGFPQKQYAWETWDNTNADKPVSILGFPANSDWVIYAPWDDKALMRNYLIYSRARLLSGGDGFGMRTRFCEVFFNQNGGPLNYANSYRGVYVFMEKIKLSKDRVELAKMNTLTTDPTGITGGYIVKHDRLATEGDTYFNTTSGVQIGSVDPDAWNSAQTSYISGYFNSFENALNNVSFDNLTTGYQSYIDRDTFIDNQWLIEIGKQIDGYRLSQYFWKDRGGKLKNGPVWDYNLSLGNANYLYGDLPQGWYYTQLGGADYAWYPRLHQHNSGASPYELRHWDRYWEMRRGLFATANILGEIDSEAAALLNGSTTAVGNSMAALPPVQENAVMRHYRKWPVLGTYLWPNAGGEPGGPATITPRPWQVNTTFQSEVDWMKNWLSQRLTWIDNQNFVGSIIYRPPNFSSLGGNINAGTSLTMSVFTGTPPSGYTYASGAIYYTTDGSDPRGSNGLPAGTAYTAPLNLSSSKIVKARLYGASNWSPVSTASFIVNAVPASAANLVVSELMYHPLDATAAESSAGYTNNDFEYVELLNVSSGNVDLSNVAFTEGIQFNFGASNPTLLTLPPGGRIVVTGGVNAFLSRYGNNSTVKVAGTFSGSLSNSGERITLTGATGSTIAQFTYGTGEPWPKDADGGVYNTSTPPVLAGGGYSLVLNNPAAGVDYSDAAGWRSSAQIGGTPGLANDTPFTGLANGDTDEDGIKDFFEYATGSDPALASSRALPVVTLASLTVNNVAGQYLKLDYRRNLSADGVRYNVQYSEDLGSWLGDGSVVTFVGSHNNGDGTATMTYRSTLPLSSARPKMFLRLMVQP